MAQNIEKTIFGIVLLAALVYIGFSIKGAVDLRRERDAVERQCDEVKTALDTNTRSPIPADPSEYSGRVRQDWKALPKTKALRPSMFYEVGRGR